MAAVVETPRAVDSARRLAFIAAVACVLLTGTAFWLSYDHLHTVASTYGLDGAAAWAWPATVDLFIVIGELLILRASLRGQGMDGWAVTLTASGSFGSIALNVAGVGDHAEGMEYVVAAVPPIAALLAFGALMRQLHGVLAGRAKPTAGGQDAPDPGANEDRQDERQRDRQEERQKPPTGGDGGDRKTPAKKRRKSARGNANTRRPMNDWVTLAGPVFHDEFRRLRRKPTASEFADAIEAAGLGSVSESTAKNIRTEILDRAELPSLEDTE